MPRKAVAQCLQIGMQTSLGSRVARQTSTPALAGNAADPNQMARALYLKALSHRQQPANGTFEIYLDGFKLLFNLITIGALLIHDAGVVDENFQSAQVPKRPLEQCGDFFRVFDVMLVGEDANPMLLGELIGQLFKLF